MEEPNHAKPDAAQAAEQSRKQADRERRPEAEAGRDCEPDEGIRPGQLTSENDGGSQG